MKNISIVLNIVLFIGLGTLYYLHFSSAKTSPAETAQQGASTVGESGLSIAYINVDTVLMKYNLAIELNESLTKKQQNMKAKLDKETSDFQKDAQVFQDKVQRGIFLTQQRAEEAQQQLAMRQQELQQLEYDYSNQLAAEQQKMNAQLFDSVTNYLKIYNTPEKYHIILGHSLTGNLLYASKKLEITDEILKGLNSRYPAKK